MMGIVWFNVLHCGYSSHHHQIAQPYSTKCQSPILAVGCVSPNIPALANTKTNFLQQFGQVLILSPIHKKSKIVH